jgi:hypothetical protein
MLFSRFSALFGVEVYATFLEAPKENKQVIQA